MKVRPPKPGECYRNALLFAQDNEGWAVVHGIVWNPAKQIEMGHAWNEKGDAVYDPSVAMLLPRELYYRLGKVSYTVKYDPIKASVMTVKEKNWGPWDIKIQAAAHAQRKKSKKGKKNPQPRIPPEYIEFHLRYVPILAMVRYLAMMPGDQRVRGFANELLNTKDLEIAEAMRENWIALPTETKKRTKQLLARKDIAFASPVKGSLEAFVAKRRPVAEIEHYMTALASFGCQLMSKDGQPIMIIKWVDPEGKKVDWNIQEMLAVAREWGR